MWEGITLTTIAARRWGRGRLWEKGEVAFVGKRGKMRRGRRMWLWEKEATTMGEVGANDSWIREEVGG